MEYTAHLLNGFNFRTSKVTRRFWRHCAVIVAHEMVVFPVESRGLKKQWLNKIIMLFRGILHSRRFEAILRARSAIRSLVDALSR